MFVFYSFCLTVGFILMLPVFFLRRGKYISGFSQRFGYLPQFTKDTRPVLWLHCVSVGETQAARPLVEKIREQFPHLRLVVSTTTKTGQELAQNIFKKTAEVIFYFPFDWKFTVRRAFRHFSPQIVLLMETELWFNFLDEAHRRGIFVVLVNGRLSEKSFRRYSFIKNFIRRVLRRVDLALMQTGDDARRIMQLGMHPTKVKVTGNIKFDQSIAESDLTKILGARFAITPDAPLIVAASTHAPEEKWILQAFRKIQEKPFDQQPRLLIAPRHPERFNEVAELIKKSSFSWTRRSAVSASGDKTAEIILLDSIGELRAVYPLAEIVFVGGSLIPHGGQSILEPALAKKAIVTGFYTMNFAAAVREFSQRKALVQLPKTDEQTIVSQVAEVFTNLLQNPAKRKTLAENAFAVMEKNRGATEKTLEYLRPFLPS